MKINYLLKRDIFKLAKLRYLFASSIIFTCNFNALRLIVAFSSCDIGERYRKLVVPHRPRKYRRSRNRYHDDD